MIWARWPVINNAKTNIPKTGFVFVWHNAIGTDSVMCWTSVAGESPDLGQETLTWPSERASRPLVGGSLAGGRKGLI